jgi:dolichyl-phosphate-mannose-protein mannosyltransferase
MFEGNAGLKPKEGEVTSRPWQWPINLRGQYFSGSSYRIYLLGNPVIWWGNLILLAVFCSLYAFHAWREQRGFEEAKEVKGEDGESSILSYILIRFLVYISKLLLLCLERRDKTVWVCIWLFVGWALHYLPFYTMGRVLYFHHYFPALLFSSMLSGVILDYLFQTIASLFGGVNRKSSLHILYGICISSFAYR